MTNYKKIKQMSIKKLIAIIGIVLFLFSTMMLFSSCSKQTKAENSDNRLTVISSNLHYSIIVDNKTGVEYLYTGSGRVIVMVDKNGLPSIADENDKILAESEAEQ